MKKFKLLTIVSSLVLCLGLMMTPAYAEETDYVAISTYTETFKPANETDATLTAEVTGTAGEDGYLYLVKTLADMTYVDMTGENIGTELEEYAQGSVNYYRVKVLDKTAEATVTATFTCPGFYTGEETADDTGIPNCGVAYTFTNPLASTIGKYTVYVYAPEGNEIVKVNTPAKYAKQKLGEEDGLRYAGASGELATAGTCTIDYTYNAPLGSVAKIAIWVVAIAVGGFVFIDRYKKAKQ